MKKTHGPRSDSQDPAARGEHPRYFRLGPVVMIAIAAVVVVADQITKIIAVSQLEGGPWINVVGDTVRLVLIRNSGAAFSLGTDLTVVFSVIASVVVLALLWFSRRIHSTWWAWGLGLILGGAAGNLVDRYVRAPGILEGHVVDFISVGWWPVFNVADSSLVAGVIVIAVTVLLGVNYDGTRQSDAQAGEGKDVNAKAKANDNVNDNNDDDEAASATGEDRADG